MRRNGGHSKRRNGGGVLNQIAVPAALFYTNQLFSKNRPQPVPASYRRTSKNRTSRRRRSSRARTSKK